MIDERMIAKTITKFRMMPINEQMEAIESTITNMKEGYVSGYCFNKQPYLQDAAFYAKLLSLETNILAREIEAMRDVTHGKE